MIEVFRGRHNNERERVERDMHGVGERHASHMYFIDGMRGVLILYIVLHHIWVLMESVRSLRIFSLGAYAVQGFFVFSGFVLALSYFRRGIAFPRGVVAYIRRRVLRLLPSYYAGILLSLLFLLLFNVKAGVPYFPSYVFPPLRELVYNGLLVQNITQSIGAVNGDYWFMAMEFQLSLLFPLILLSFRIFGRAWAPALWIALILSYLVLFPQKIGSGSSALMLSLFLFGMLAARLVHNRRQGQKASDNLHYWAGGCLGAFMLAVFFLSFTQVPVLSTYRSFLELITGMSLGIVFLSLLVLLSSGSFRWMRRILEWRPLMYLGMISYSMYLVHSLIHRVFYKYVISTFPLEDGVLKFLVLFVLDFPVVLLVSILFFHLIERPVWLRWLRKA